MTSGALNIDNEFEKKIYIKTDKKYMFTLGQKQSTQHDTKQSL